MLPRLRTLARLLRTQATSPAALAAAAASWWLYRHYATSSSSPPTHVRQSSFPVDPRTSARVLKHDPSCLHVRVTDTNKHWLYRLAWRALSRVLGLLDWVYSLLSHRHASSGWFKHGWGTALSSSPHTRVVMLPEPCRVQLTWSDRAWHVDDGRQCAWRDAHFVSPCAAILPRASHDCHVRVVVPLGQVVDGCELGDDGDLSKVLRRDTRWVMHMPASGDEGFEWRTRRIAVPLACDPIMPVASVLLEYPFYGRRAPPGVSKGELHRVCDVGKLGMGAGEESRGVLAMLHEQGFERLGVCGISMGGHLACAVALLVKHPVALCDLVGGEACPVYTEGLIRRAIPYHELARELEEKHDVPTSKSLGEAVHRLRVYLDQQVGVQQLLDPEHADPDHVVAMVKISSRDDLIVPHSSSESLTDRIAQLPRSRVRQVWVPGGHVSAFAFHLGTYRRGIVDSFHVLDAMLE